MPNSVVTVDVVPGYYLENQTINVSFGPNVREVAINKNGRPPSISKHIAYDTLNPPNPFISVTEDGRGRVVYDGGFPKLYDNRGHGVNSTQIKYIVNVLDWVSDPARVAASGKGILFLGDRISGSYRIDVRGGSHFRNTIDTIIQAGGYSGSTVKVSSNYPGNRLDARFSELNQYAAVFIFSTAGPLITQDSVDDLVRYRESGGGIFVITDHGPFLNSLESAITSSSGFFHTANAIVTRFGAWFSGDYNRTSVNVGFLRRTYGDHPLYNGLSDSESILAGGSESRIFVTSDSTTPPNQAPRQYTTEDGVTTINVMAVLDDGSMVPRTFEYHVVNSATLFHIKGKDYGHSQIVDIGADNYIDMGLIHMGVDIAMEADIFLDEVKIGTASKELGSPVIWTPLNGDSNRVHINNNSTISLVYTNPTGYRASIYISRETVPYFEVEDLIYPKYDEFLGNLLVGQHTSPGRLEQTAGIRRDIMALPSIIRYSKDNLNRIYGDMEPTYVVGVEPVASDGTTFTGTTWTNNGEGSRPSGLLFPEDPTVGIYSRADDNYILGYSYKIGQDRPAPLAIYMDSTGPFYLIREAPLGYDEHYALYYSNGVTNVYQYLQNRIGQNVEFRFLY